jgi:hypothetical protein
MRDEAISKHDFDGFWKDALTDFLEEFLALVAPDVRDAID